VKWISQAQNISSISAIALASPSTVKEVSMKIDIRRASTEDYNALCDLFDEIDSSHRDNLPHIFQKPNGPIRELDYYLGIISDENVGLFIAEMDGDLVGFVHVVVREAPDIPIFVPRRYAVVDSIAVKSGYRNHGIGRMLMDTMEEWTVERGVTSIELNVYEFNEVAIAFYERLGYQTLSRKLSKGLN
jgi:ribosomal protein S18 acetylase RimI-like enzyme